MTINRVVSGVYSDTESMYLYHSGGVKAPTSTGKACVMLEDVVPPELTTRALEPFLAKKYMPPDDEHRKHFHANDTLYHKVKFSEQHELITEAPFDEYSKATQEIAKIAIQRFANELKLTGDNKIAITFIEYDITQKLPAYRWHTDIGASWTMITLLTNPNDATTGWTGGELSRSTFFSSVKEHAFIQPVSSVTKTAYSQYNAILFHNFGTMHQVEAMAPLNTAGSRVILQIGLIDHRNDGTIGEISNYIKTSNEIEMKVRNLKALSEVRF